MYWITDAGHGWLAVDLSKYPDAVKSGTGFGFQKKGTIYLEEDCEATHFLFQHPEIDPKELRVVNDGDYSHIRMFPKNRRMYSPFGR